MALPAWDARMVQMPIATKVTLVPATVHTGGVSDAKLTVNPDDAVALTVNGEAVNARSASTPKVIVWSAAVMTWVSVGLTEAALFASPP